MALYRAQFCFLVKPSTLLRIVWGKPVPRLKKMPGTGVVYFNFLPHSSLWKKKNRLLSLRNQGKLPLTIILFWFRGEGLPLSDHWMLTSFAICPLLPLRTWFLLSLYVIEMELISLISVWLSTAGLYLQMSLPTTTIALLVDQVGGKCCLFYSLCISQNMVSSLQGESHRHFLPEAKTV